MFLKKYLIGTVVTGGLISFAACSDDGDMGNGPGTDGGDASNGKYVACLGVTSSDATTYYLVTADDLMEGTVSAKGNGIEQTGYHDFRSGGNTVFSIGGMGVVEANGFTLNSGGQLQKKGKFVFDATLNGLEQVDDKTMLGVEFPKNPQAGDVFKFYTVDINTVAITRTVTHPVSQLSTLDWPGFTGMRISDNKVYMTFYLSDPSTYETKYVDTAYVAVYSYPELEYITMIKDTRTGPAGAWNTDCGIQSDEKGDLYTMSTTAIANGFSQNSRTPAGFLRIRNGDTTFDPDYYFDIQAATGGLRPAHIRYVGNGLVYAEISTVKNQEKWKDVDLKVCIIDLYNKTVTEVPEIPVHDGNGGRSFTAMVQGNYVYHPVTLPEGTFIYRTDVKTASAVKGAEVETTFVGGLYHITPKTNE